MLEHHYTALLEAEGDDFQVDPIRAILARDAVVFGQQW